MSLPRRSTVLLAAVFVATFVLYLAVRPAPAASRASARGDEPVPVVPVPTEPPTTATTSPPDTATTATLPPTPTTAP